MNLPSLRHLVASTVALAVALPLSAALTAPASAAAADDDVLRVLLFSSGDGVHGSVANTRAAVKELSSSLALEHGLDNNTGDPAQAVADIQETTNAAAAFTPANLATKDVLVFAHTAGVLFNTEQRAALESYIRGGGGFVGIHYTAWSPDQTEHDVNPFYRRLIGAASTGHPEPGGGQRGTVTVSDGSHPLTTGLQSPLSYTDEWYEWDVNPSQDVRTLVTVDESSFPAGTEVGEEGTTHPVTWCQKIDQGRSWYSSLGHHASAYTAADDGGNANDNDADDFVRTQLRRGLAYSAALLPADCSPPAKDQQGSWSGVTPWPLVPINAALTSDGKVQSFGSVSSGCTDPSPYDWGGNDCVTQGGQMEIDVWDPAVVRTVSTAMSGLLPNATYTDLFCSMQVQMPHRRSTMTVGGDDGLGGNAPNDSAIGVTSYSTNSGLRNEAPMNFPRWYPTGTTAPDGSVVVQGGALRGGPGGPGVLTPEVYRPDAGSSWKLLTGATSAQAYGDGFNGGPDENRWWYPRAFVAPTNGKIFNISGTQMFELDPSGDGTIAMRGTLGAGTGNQGALGNPVGATSTATMYRPGKILQVGGGTWSNGGGPAGARAGITVDISAGTANPVVTATDPMKYARHWATSTVMPDGNVIVTGGSRDNNGNGGYVTNAEIWDPTKPSGQQWSEVKIPYEHARLYHSVALLLPDGRIMIGGGGTPGPRNYTDVEYYSPAYLFDGNVAATRPQVTNAPRKVGYNGSFTMTSDSTISRVTLVRNGSVTHGFNNDQNFQDLAFTQSGNTVSITSPANGNYAPPGAYMVFLWNAAGTPSMAKIVQIDPQVKMDSPAPKVVDQFEYPRLPVGWQANNVPTSFEVAPGNGRMSPWEVQSQVQLIRAAAAGMGGLGLTGDHLATGTTGKLTLTLEGLDVGKEYRLAMRYARDSRSAGTAPGAATLSIG
ncbi:MAG TPA: ThuA domain-containing protein, partial [Nocardioides sp.]|nr:ThuA domain-containing protein [Nocardioides sp.]